MTSPALILPDVSASNASCSESNGRAVPVNVNYRYVEDELRYLFTDADLNESRARVGRREQLAWFANPSNHGRVIDLPSGQVGDEGWFTLTTVPGTWASAGPASSSGVTSWTVTPVSLSPEASTDR